MGELRRGVTLLAEQSPRRAELERMIHEKVPSWFQDRILPVTRMIAERWGVLDGERQLAGRPMNIADGMIAATALEHDLTLVTRNVKDFAGLGVAVFSPWGGLSLLSEEIERPVTDRPTGTNVMDVRVVLVGEERAKGSGAKPHGEDRSK